MIRSYFSRSAALRSVTLLLTLLAGSAFSLCQERVIQGHAVAIGAPKTYTVNQLMAAAAARPHAPRPTTPVDREAQKGDHFLRLPLAPNPDTLGLPITTIPQDVSREVHGWGPKLAADPMVFGLNFPATDLNDGAPVTPPDTMGDVGPDQYFVTTNGKFKLLDKQGNLGAINLQPNDFWAPVLSPGQDTSDPRVRYDPYTNRWWLVMITVDNGANQILIAYSDGSHIDGTSSFHFLKFRSDLNNPSSPDAGSFADYPTLGVDSQALYIGCNMFGATANNTTLYVLPKTNLVSANPLVVPFTTLIDTNGNGPHTPQGVSNYTDNVASPGPGYAIGVDVVTSGLLHLLVINNPGSSTPTITMKNVNVLPTAQPINPQVSGSPGSLDADDMRLMEAQIAIDSVHGGVPTLWTAHHIGLDGTGHASSTPDRDGVQWYQISLGSTPSMIQGGTLFDSKGDSLIYPAIMTTQQGVASVGFTFAGLGVNPSIFMARRFSDDTPNTMPQMGTVYGSNDTFQISPNRFGDYSFTSLDPVDGQTLWTTQETSGPRTWATRVATLLAPPPPPIASVNPSMVTLGYNGPMTIKGTISGHQMFFHPSKTLGNKRKDMLVSITDGTSVWGIAGAMGPITPDTISPNVSIPTFLTPSGAYSLVVQNPDGQKVTGGTVSVVPPLTGFTLSQNTVIGGGNTVTGTLTIGSSAPVDESIALSVPNGSPVTMPASVKVLKGATSATFTINTSAVNAATTVKIDAVDPGAVDKLSQSVVVNPPNQPAFTAFTPAVTTILGGQHVTGTVTIASGANSPGAIVQITSSNTAAIASGSVTIATGTTSTNFDLTSTPVAANTDVTLTASLSGSASKTAIIHVQAPAVQALTFPQASTPASGQLTGTVTLNGTAPQGGVAVVLTSSNPAAFSVPANANVSNTNSTTFPGTAANVSADTTVTVSAAFNGATKTATVKVISAKLKTFSLSASTVQGGTNLSATIVLQSAAGSNGQNIALTSSATPVSVPAAFNVPAGQSFGFVTVTTAPVLNTTVATVSAKLNGTTLQGNLTVTPAPLRLLSLNATSIVGGLSTGGTVYLAGPAGPAKETVPITSSVPSAATYYINPVIQPGQTSANFTVVTFPVDTDTLVTLTGTYQGVSKSANLTVLASSLSGMTLKTGSIVGGNGVFGTVTFSGKLGPSGADVTLTSSDTNSAVVSSPLHVGKNATVGFFNVFTRGVSSPKAVTLTASQGGKTFTQILNVLPAQIVGLVPSIQTITSGAQVTFAINLSGAAPVPNGGTVTLKSYAPNVLAVPASAFVFGGTSSRTFTGTAGTVTKSTVVTVTATYNGTTVGTNVTVNP